MLRLRSPPLLRQAEGLAKQRVQEVSLVWNLHKRTFRSYDLGNILHVREACFDLRHKDWYSS